MKKIIIFGGSGFLGKHIVEEFLKKNYKITVFDSQKLVFSRSKIDFIKGDITNYNSVYKAIKNQDYVYNFAAISDIEESLKKPLHASNVNILGTLNTLEASKIHKVKKYIYASSIYVLSSQGGIYRVSKKSSELFIQEYGNRYNLNYVILRFGSVFGEGADKKNGIAKILYNIKKKRIIKYSGTKKAVRKFIHVTDASKLSVKVISNKFSKTSVLITGRYNIKLKDLMNYLKKELGIIKKIVYSNRSALGHYDKNPYSYKNIPSLIINYKPKNDFKTNLNRLIKDLKK